MTKNKSRRLPLTHSVALPLCAMAFCVNPVVATGPPDVTVEAIDVNPGAANGNPSRAVVWQDGLYFSAKDDGTYCREVWTGDIGTGPILVANINATSSNCDGVGTLFDEQAAAMSSSFVFRARPLGAGDTGWEPWRSEGTPETTTIIRDINPFSGDSDPHGFAAVRNDSMVAFGAFQNGLGIEPWITDGEPAGTSNLADIASGSDSSLPYGFTALSQTEFVFFADDGSGSAHELYVSDGSSVSFVEDINPTANASSDPEFLTPFAGKDKVVFFADDGVTGREPWITDGTAAGTFRLADINPGPASSNNYDTGDNDGFVQLGDLMFFSADDGVSGRELWATDGTTLGTEMVREINPGPNSGFDARAAVFQGLLHFVGPGFTLWRSDGTFAGTELWQTFMSPGPRDLEAVGDLLYFARGDELWVSDGTAAGTVLVKSFDGLRSPTDLTAVNSGLLALRASTIEDGHEMFLAYPTPDLDPPPPPTVEISPDPVTIGEMAQITVTASDVTTGNSNIASIEYQRAGGTWFSLPASDGAYDEPTESGSDSIVFEHGGTFEFCGRATDAAGNQSAPHCIEIEVPADLRLRAIEVNQVVQNWRNEVPLFKEKATLVRVFLESIDDPSLVSGNGVLHVRRDGAPLDGSPLLSDGAGATTDDASQFALVGTTGVNSWRESLGNSIEFLLPPQWTDVAGSVDLELEFELMEPVGASLACAEPDGLEDCTVVVTFDPWSLQQMDFWAVPYVVDGVTFAPSAEEMAEQVRRITDTFPVKRIDYRLRELPPYSGLPGLNQVNLAIVAMRQLERLGGGTQPIASFGVMLGSGIGRAVKRVGSWFTGNGVGLTGTGFARNRGSHEAAHAFGERHAVTTEGFRRRGICDATAGGGTAFHPYVEDTGIINRDAEIANSTLWPTIGPLSLGPDDELWGASPRAFSNGLADSLVVTDPRFSAALMSYCANQSPTGSGAMGGQARWMSDNVYESLAAHFARGVFEDNVPTRGGLGEYALVIGSIEGGTGEVTLAPLLTVFGSDPGYDPGDIHVAIVDDLGVEIASLDVELLEAGDPDGPGFVEGGGYFVAPIPIPGGADPAAVVVEVASLEVARLDESPNPPTVTIDSPDSSTIASEAIPLAWSAADVDGDPLTASVSLSLDGGVTWQSLLHGVQESSFDVPVRYLGDSTQASIRVRVSDGFHSAVATSDLFVVEAGLPIASVISPAFGAEVPADGLIQLSGSGWDPEDGTDLEFEWIADFDSSSSISLGLGSELAAPADQLTPGCHTVTLVVTDSDTNAATDEIVIDIGSTNCLFGRLFSDDFDTGDIAAWSNSVP